MANPRRRKHRFVSRGRKRARRPRKARPSKEALAEKERAPENGEAVRHYGDAWDYEHYEKESLKAKGLFL